MSVNGWRDKEKVACVHSVLFSHKAEWNYVILQKANDRRKLFAVMYYNLDAIMHIQFLPPMKQTLWSWAKDLMPLNYFLFD
jgi:hypothetical protein